ncbi:MAG: lysozyme inhibitor LprI family protein [Bacteroidota bacterium]
MKKVLLFFVFTVLFWGSSKAQTRNYLMDDGDTIQMYHIDSMLVKCLDNFQTNDDLLVCLKSHRKMWEDSLNSYVSKLNVLMDKELQNRLSTSQFAWKTDLDADEKLWEEMHDKNELWHGDETAGTMLQYFLDRVRERALDMKYYLKQFTMMRELEKKKIKK